MRTALAALSLATLAKLAAAQAAVSESQFWHERYHGLLSMAAYSTDPTTVCAQSFDKAALASSFPNSTEAPWTYIQGFGPTPSGAEGFTVIIPEMDKVVMVFKGLFGWESTFNESTANVGTLLGLGASCANCTAHAGATQAYLEAKAATNDWELVKNYVNATRHQWSITGHGFGGMVAQVASLDLGWRGLSHWTHNHGAARVFNAPAANLMNQLYAGEAGQRVVANHDPVPTYIAESANYTFALQGLLISGNGTTNKTYGYDYTVCVNPSDATCFGTAGGPIDDHLAYYTPIGTCGKPYYGSNTTVEDAYLATASAAHHATATSTFVAPSTEIKPTSTPPPASFAVSTGAAAATGANAAGASGSSSSSSGKPSSQDHSSGAQTVGVAGSLLALVAGAFAVMA